MFKKIIILSLVLLSLSSCFGGDTDNSEVSSETGLALFENDDFSMFIPASWEIIKNDDSSIIPKPANGDVALAVVKKQLSGFSNNLLVLSEKLEEELSSTQYSVLNNIGSKSDYYSYRLIEEKDIEFVGLDKSKLYIFDARYSENTPTLSFLQTAVVCPNNKGYLLTIGLTKGQTSFIKYENIFKTFRCK